MSNESQPNTILGLPFVESPGLKVDPAIKLGVWRYIPASGLRVGMLLKLVKGLPRGRLTRVEIDITAETVEVNFQCGDIEADATFPFALMVNVIDPCE